MYKRAWCTCRVVVLPLQPTAFWKFSLSSPSWHLKVPNDSQCTEAPPPPPLREKKWTVQASPRLFFFFWRERGVCTLAVEMSTYNSKRNVLNFSTFVTNIVLWNWRSNKAHQLFFNRAPLHFAVNNRQANCQLACMTGWTCPPSSRAPERRFPFSFPFERLTYRRIANRKVLLFCGLPGYSWPIEFLITECELYISFNSFFVWFISSIHKRQGDTYYMAFVH